MHLSGPHQVAGSRLDLIAAAGHALQCHIVHRLLAAISVAVPGKIHYCVAQDIKDSMAEAGVTVRGPYWLATLAEAQGGVANLEVDGRPARHAAGRLPCECGAAGSLGARLGAWAPWLVAGSLMVGGQALTEGLIGGWIDLVHKGTV